MGSVSNCIDRFACYTTDLLTVRIDLSVATTWTATKRTNLAKEGLVFLNPILPYWKLCLPYLVRNISCVGR